MTGIIEHFGWNAAHVMRLIDVYRLRVAGRTSLSHNNVINNQSSILPVAVKHNRVPLVVAVRFGTDQKGRTSSAIERKVKLIWNKINKLNWRKEIVNEIYFSILEIQGGVIDMAILCCVENDSVRFRSFEFDRQVGFLSVTSRQGVVLVSTEFDVTKSRSTAVVDIRIIWIRI